jgi:hypothetical protein
MTHSVGREVIRQQGRLRTAQIKKPRTKAGLKEGPEKAPKGEAMERQIPWPEAKGGNCLHHYRKLVYTDHIG